MEELDLRGVKCPMNFVKTRLKLDKMEPGAHLCVLLDPGEPVESVSESVMSEGHSIESTEEQADKSFRVLIKRA